VRVGNREACCRSIPARFREYSLYGSNREPLHYHETRSTGMSSKCVSIL